MDVFKPAVVLAAYFTFVDLFAGAWLWHHVTGPILSQLNAALAVHP